MPTINESKTHGGPRKEIHFKWWFDPNIRSLMIESEKSRLHRFQLDEIFKILLTLKSEFGEQWFPLANNVEKLADGTERRGLGAIILDNTPGDITHAQGASYLGPVLVNIGYFEWNGKYTGIKWRLLTSKIDLERLAHDLTKKQSVA